MSVYNSLANQKLGLSDLSNVRISGPCSHRKSLRLALEYLSRRPDMTILGSQNFMIYRNILDTEDGYAL